MIVERFIVIGIKHTRKVITDVINGSSGNSNSYGNGMNFNISLDFLDDTVSPIITDHKKFDIKEDAIEHIRVIKTQNYINDAGMTIHDIGSWSIISVYDEIYDPLQVRKYKILNLKKKLR